MRDFKRFWFVVHTLWIATSTSKSVLQEVLWQSNTGLSSRTAREGQSAEERLLENQTQPNSSYPTNIGSSYEYIF